MEVLAGSWRAMTLHTAVSPRNLVDRNNSIFFVTAVLPAEEKLEKTYDFKF